jgi:hypothetical protein
LPCFEGLTRQVCVFEPWRSEGCIIRVHFSIREASFEGKGAGGTALRDWAEGLWDDGPARTTASGFRKGAFGTRTRRS